MSSLVAHPTGGDEIGEAAIDCHSVRGRHVPRSFWAIGGNANALNQPVVTTNDVSQADPEVSEDQPIV